MAWSSAQREIYLHIDKWIVFSFFNFSFSEHIEATSYFMVLKIISPYLGLSDFGWPPIFRKQLNLDLTLILKEVLRLYKLIDPIL